MKKKILLKNQNGLTLVEVLVGIILLSIIATGFVLSMTTAVRGNDSVKRIDLATAQAEQKLEEFRNMDYFDVDLSSGSDTVNQYVRQWIITRDSIQSDILVTVYVPPQYEKSVSVQSIISKP